MNALKNVKEKVLNKYHRIDILINNAANNSRMANDGGRICW